MRKCVVMDTNVAIVANGKTPQASDACIKACIDRLEKIKKSEIMLIDNRRLMIEEYRQHLSHSGQPGAGDAFFKWLWNNQATLSRCRQISITPNNNDRCFDEFPDSPELANFDRSDRKFVATALASGSQPCILNASDTDWWEFRESLSHHNICIEFICPELMEREN